MPHASPDPSTPSRQVGAGTCQVLVVDDDRDIRETLQELLEEEGYHVSAAKNGLEALASLRLSRPELILLDLFMPVMDGMEFRRQQMTHPDISDIPVVVLSAAVGLEERAASMGVAAHLEKPLQIEALFDLIGRYCT